LGPAAASVPEWDEVEVPGSLNPRTAARRERGRRADRWRLERARQLYRPAAG
jgi:hypothetical protein